MATHDWLGEGVRLYLIVVAHERSDGRQWMGEKGAACGNRTRRRCRGHGRSIAGEVPDCATGYQIQREKGSIERDGDKESHQGLLNGRKSSRTADGDEEVTAGLELDGNGFRR